jgi:hypothetical protein
MFWRILQPPMTTPSLLNGHLLARLSGLFGERVVVEPGTVSSTREGLSGNACATAAPKRCVSLRCKTIDFAGCLQIRVGDRSSAADAHGSQSPSASGKAQRKERFAQVLLEDVWDGMKTPDTRAIDNFIVGCAGTSKLSPHNQDIC